MAVREVKSMPAELANKHFDAIDSGDWSVLSTYLCFQGGEELFDLTLNHNMADGAPIDYSYSPSGSTLTLPAGVSRPREYHQDQLFRDIPN
jgi:hypothetical protein